MPISVSQLMAACPSTEEEQIQFVDLARSVGEHLSQQMAESVASLMKANFKPRYSPPPFIPPLTQRQHTTIVINLTIDLPLKE